MSYMTISSQEKHNFSLCSCFHAHPTTLLLKILEDQCMGGPHLKFWGDRPPSPPRSPPLLAQSANCASSSLSYGVTLGRIITYYAISLMNYRILLQQQLLSMLCSCY